MTPRNGMNSGIPIGLKPPHDIYTEGKHGTSRSTHISHVKVAAKDPSSDLLLDEALCLPANGRHLVVVGGCEGMEFVLRHSGKSYMVQMPRCKRRDHRFHSVSRIHLEIRTECIFQCSESTHVCNLAKVKKDVLFGGIVHIKGRWAQQSPRANIACRGGVISDFGKPV